VTDSIFHITSRAAWIAGKEAGVYKADTLASAGFIHCSKLDQVLRVANEFYSNQPDLVLLEIDSSRLKPKLHWEPGTDKADELFPHVYGPLNLDSVLNAFDLKPGLDGKFHLPPEIGMATI
jgi:uncharacterized protein (DUF952 family)